MDIAWADLAGWAFFTGAFIVFITGWHDRDQEDKENDR